MLAGSRKRRGIIAVALIVVFTMVLYCQPYVDIVCPSAAPI